MAESPYLGQIIMFAGNFAISGFAECNGELLSISQNTALFSILGTTYGGDGVSTFALPDLRSRVPIHTGQGAGLSNYVLGQTGGSENVTLTANQLPAHTHPVNVGGSQTTNQPSGSLLAQNGAYSSGTTASGTAAATFVGATGGSDPHTNIQPYLTLTFLIALEGIFPSRN